jgi:hypothetical protein
MHPSFGQLATVGGRWRLRGRGVIGRASWQDIVGSSTQEWTGPHVQPEILILIALLHYTIRRRQASKSSIAMHHSSAPTQCLSVTACLSAACAVSLECRGVYPVQPKALRPDYGYAAPRSANAFGREYSPQFSNGVSVVCAAACPLLAQKTGNERFKVTCILQAPEYHKRVACDPSFSYV